MNIVVGDVKGINEGHRVGPAVPLLGQGGQLLLHLQQHGGHQLGQPIVES